MEEKHITADSVDDLANRMKINSFNESTEIVSTQKRSRY